MERKKSERLSNFELMRFISMVLIVMWHLILHSELYSSTSGATKFFLEFLVLLGVVHVNSFVLVTGYFQYDKKISLKKIVNLIKNVWFYKVLFVLIAILFFGKNISKLELFNELLPIDMRDYWFINCYLVLCILSPFINLLIEKMNQKQHRKILIVFFILFSVIPYLTNNTTISNDGYTIINFTFLYLIGAYLKKYPLKENIHFKYYSDNKMKVILLSIMLFSLLFNFILYQFSKQVMMIDNVILVQFGNNLNTNYRSFSSPLVIIQSISYFLLFSCMMIKSNFINKISKNIVDVYLIHENYYITQVLYFYLGTYKWLKLNCYLIILLTIFIPFIITIVCLIISFLKGLLFSFIESRNMYKKIKRKIYRFIENF